MQAVKTNKFKTLEALWLWTVAIVFSIAGVAACACWAFGIFKFIMGLING